LEPKVDKFLLRMPAELKSKVEQIAKDDRRSLNTQLIIAVEQFVNSYGDKGQYSKEVN